MKRTMCCRLEATETKRSAVGKIVAMYCRFAGSVRGKRKQCGWDDQILLEVLSGKRWFSLDFEMRLPWPLAQKEILGEPLGAAVEADDDAREWVRKAMADGKLCQRFPGTACGGGPM
jgi:hypothetical protein